MCGNFFEKVEEEMKTYRVKYQEMMDSFDVWNKNHKKPSDLREAALYALEARMLNEESTRINEAIMVRDVLNKVIYSIQQHVSATSPFLRNKIDLEET